MSVVVVGDGKRYPKGPRRIATEDGRMDFGDVSDADRAFFLKSKCATLE